MNQDISDMLHKAAELAPKIVRITVCEQGWGILRASQTVIGGEPLNVGGKEYGFGYGTHARSRIRLESAVPLTHFCAVAGPAVDRDSIIHGVARMAPIRFLVQSGGKTLAESPLLKFNEVFVFDVKLDHVSELELVVEPSGDIDMTHANWCEPVLTTADGKHFRCGKSGLPALFPVDFGYGEMTGAQFFAAHGLQHTAEKHNDHTLHRFVSANPSLVMTVELKAWHDFPVWEWHTYFTNPSAQKSLRLYDISPLSADYLLPPAPGEPKLLRLRGSFHTDSRHQWPGDGLKNSFTPVCDDLSFEREITFGATGGRPSDEWLPCFDLAAGDTNLRCVVGWAGQWQAKVTASGGGCRLTAKLEDADLMLEPGETIEVPSIFIQYNSEGGNDHAVNLWRRFATKHIMLPKDTRLPHGPLSFMSWGGLAEPGHLNRLENIVQRQLPIDVYWMDAGWFAPKSANEFSPEWSQNVGDWDFNCASFPQELSNIARVAHQAGKKLLLWFEPERVRTTSKLAKEHPELLIFNHTGNALLDLGDPAAWQWCFDKISSIIERNHLDWYRQDFNFEPLPYWRSKDAPGRKGITEIRYVTGLYRFWRELKLKFPHLMIDNCASGGRRLDVELLRYSMPLWYSDMQCNPGFNPEFQLTHIAGMARYWPRFGTGTQNPEGGDTYNFRAAMNAALGIQCFYGTFNPVSDDYPFDWLRARLHEYRAVRDCFAGDYYSLSAPDGSGGGMWTVMQYDLPEAGHGLLTVFRGPQSPAVECTLPLRGLGKNADYLVEDMDQTFAPVTVSGQTLLTAGLTLRIAEPRTARLIRYRKLAVK